MRLFAVIVLQLCLAAAALAAERVVEVIPLKHRLVGDVLPVVKPLVADGGTVTGMNNQLIVKSSPANIAEIKKVLGDIDRAPRQLLITVKHDSSGSRQRQRAGVSGRVGTGEVTVETDGSLEHEELLDRLEKKRNNQLKLEMEQRRQSSDERHLYRVQATEGYPAHIQAGVSLPFATRDVYVAPGNVIVRDGYQYADASSGFYVLPRLQGDTVTLEIAPRVTHVQTGHGPPTIRMQNVQTVISGKLGEWIPVGGVNETQSRSDEALLSRGSSQRQQDSAFLIRVEEVGR